MELVIKGTFFLISLKVHRKAQCIKIILQCDGGEGHIETLIKAMTLHSINLFHVL